jgi:hypothetical protein
MALEEKEIPYKYNEVNPYHKSPEFLKINPFVSPCLPILSNPGDVFLGSYTDRAVYVHPISKGLVPAVEHNGMALYESLVLLEVRSLPSSLISFLSSLSVSSVRSLTCVMSLYFQ